MAKNHLAAAGTALHIAMQELRAELDKIQDPIAQPERYGATLGAIEHVEEAMERLS